ncbi:response regulator [Aeromonas dhakensis]|uniref:response regulator n=1 Tax=Aeromonas dhakensis TaxID=196024 RepID=UPI0020B25587|nr:response regulator [Aeromonas dhakensis]MDD9308497.1 response regulator [Aeromonas hydrophila]WPS56314.1 response regulator [Aeromonas dhakensis]WRT73866.1 response regulator [Aeromonas dhakensis]CAD7492647.1 DNA-binding response regulator [Aeromonas dhakensis]CAD7502763.1 DNA-binding response regulator [Aeromonas dhakensis]
MDNKVSIEEMQALKVLLVDDHAILRAGVKATLSTDHLMKVIAEAGNGKEGLDLAVEYEPDLILLDLQMPVLNGLETLKRIRAKKIKSKVVIFTESDLEIDVVEAFRFGANGYLSKNIEPLDLIGFIKSICADTSIESPQSNNKVMSISLSDSNVGIIESLSHREIDVVKLLAEGHSNKVISKLLFISHGTVKIHVRNILRKLKLNSRVAVTVWAHNRTIK